MTKQELDALWAQAEAIKEHTKVAAAQTVVLDDVAMSLTNVEGSLADLKSAVNSVSARL